ncbi:MAG: hypothetical protein V7699_01025 [Porticoccus sp.]
MVFTRHAEDKKKGLHCCNPFFYGAVPGNRQEVLDELLVLFTPALDNVTEITTNRIAATIPEKAFTF